VCPVMGRGTAAGSLSRYGGRLWTGRSQVRIPMREAADIDHWKAREAVGEFLTMPMLMMMITMPPVHDAAVIVVAL